MRVTAGLLVSLLILVSLAGCFSTSNNDGGENDPTQPPASSFAPRTLYLSPDSTLVEQAPQGEGSIEAGDFITKWATRSGAHPQFNLEGFDPELSPWDWISADNATITLYLTTDAPVFPAEGVLPDVAVWLGSSLHAPLVASTKLDGPLMPDEVTPVSFELEGPESQPAILGLGGITLFVTVTMTQQEEHNVRILTGGEHASEVQLETKEFRPADLDIQGQLVLENQTISGELLLSDRFLTGVPDSGMTHADHEIEVGENDQVLLAFVQPRGDGGIMDTNGHTVDMDMTLMDPKGETITWGVTPYPFEQLWLVGDSLSPYQGETLTLRVSHHLGVNMEYEGIIQTG